MATISSTSSSSSSSSSTSTPSSPSTSSSSSFFFHFFFTFLTTVSNVYPSVGNIGSSSQDLVGSTTAVYVDRNKFHSSSVGSALFKSFERGIQSKYHRISRYV